MITRVFIAWLALAVFGLGTIVTGCSKQEPSQTKGNSSDPNVEATQTLKARSGKYEVEFRIPDGGLYSGEEIDVEFSLTDTTKKDPRGEGFMGVADIQATAVVTMPEMPGMPAQRPEVHYEGVPGNYGVALTFAHGGAFQIELNLDIPGDGVKTFTFALDVKDDRPAATAKAQPYSLKVVGWPKMVMAGEEVDLKLQVIETKTGKVQSAFDEAHTKYFHLLIASKDLNWFEHEHPEMAADGTWSTPFKFPAGGQYWVYGDVAPEGKGSSVLITKVDVMGPEPTWDTKLTPSTVAIDGGLKGQFSALDGEVPTGRTTSLEVKLSYETTGKPAGDTVDWLGAAGHLVIIHQDGQTVVHSHPVEDAESNALVKNGIVRFSARFPRSGIYKAYAQFNWHGAVRTLGFCIEVK